MRILFAAADRDLLRSLGRLLGDALGEVVTAFDGAQVLTLAAEEVFDLAAVDRALPRVACAHIVGRMQNIGVPTLVLLDEPESLSLLREEPLA